MGGFRSDAFLVKWILWILPGDINQRQDATQTDPGKFSSPRTNPGIITMISFA